MTAGDDELLNSAESATDNKGEGAGAAACERYRPDDFCTRQLKS